MLIESKSSRIWWITDLHLGARNNSIEWLDRMTEYYYEFFIPLVKENSKEGDILIIGGDVFDNRQSLNLLVMNRGMEIFEALSKVFTNGIYIILGNHDIHRRNSNDITSVDVLKNIKGVHIFKEPEVLNIGNRHKVLMMPWRKNHHEENETIRQYKDSVDYVFCHANITTLNFNRSVLIEDGSDYNLYKGLKHVYSGHIHWRQTKGNVTFGGNPYQMTRSDAGNDKGVYLIDLESGNHDFFKNTFSPEFVRLYLDKILDWPLSKVKEICNNNSVDIYVPSEYLLKYPINDLVIVLSKITKKLEIVSFEVEDEVDLEGIEYTETLNIVNLCDKVIEGTQWEEDVKSSLKEKIKEVYKKATETEI
tara:strand:+ start:15 stop:1103 length:1089 start_codon:yes stop_codon:yes gene_type:complete